MTPSQVLCWVPGIKPSICPEELWAQWEAEKQHHDKINAMAQVSKVLVRWGRVSTVLCINLCSRDLEHPRPRKVVAL